MFVYHVPGDFLVGSSATDSIAVVTKAVVWLSLQ